LAFKARTNVLLPTILNMSQTKLTKSMDNPLNAEMIGVKLWLILSIEAGHFGDIRHSRTWIRLHLPPKFSLLVKKIR